MNYWGLIFDYQCLMFVVCCSMHTCWFMAHGSRLMPGEGLGRPLAPGPPPPASRRELWARPPRLPPCALSQDITPWRPHMHQVSSSKVPGIGWGGGVGSGISCTLVGRSLMSDFPTPIDWLSMNKKRSRGKRSRSSLKIKKHKPSSWRFHRASCQISHPYLSFWVSKAIPMRCHESHLLIWRKSILQGHSLLPSLCNHRPMCSGKATRLLRHTLQNGLACTRRPSHQCHDRCAPHQFLQSDQR